MGVLIGRSTVDWMLKKLNLILKKNTPPGCKMERASTAATLRVLAKNLIVIDESPSTLLRIDCSPTRPRNKER
jgi:hypothetical protein